MIDRNLLKAAWVAAGYNTRTAAAAVGIPEGSMYRKLREGRFDNFEIQAMIETFNIVNIKEVFFTRRKK